MTYKILNYVNILNKIHKIIINIVLRVVRRARFGSHFVLTHRTGETYPMGTARKNIVKIVS